MVLPDDTPKDIPAQHSDNLKLVLMRGQLQKEYHFTLSVPPLDDRLVVVRIKDVEAVQARQDAVARQVTAQVANYLSSSGNIAELTRLPRAQQFAKIAEVAVESVSRTAPELPSAAKWVLTADALASLGLLTPANAALQNAQQASPHIVNTQGAQMVANVISAKSGVPNVLRDPTLELPKGEPGEMVSADVTHAQVTISSVSRPRGLGADDLHAWSDLSAKMQAVPSLKAYGLSMKGDMLWAQGDTTAATDAYQKASNIQPTPWTDKKLEAVKLDEGRQAH